MASPKQSKDLSAPKEVVTGLSVTKVTVQDIFFGENFYRVTYSQGVSVDVPYTPASISALQTLENEAFQSFSAVEIAPEKV